MWQRLLGGAAAAAALQIANVVFACFPHAVGRPLAGHAAVARGVAQFHSDRLRCSSAGVINRGAAARQPAVIHFLAKL